MARSRRCSNLKLDLILAGAKISAIVSARRFSRLDGDCGGVSGGGGGSAVVAGKPRERGNGTPCQVSVSAQVDVDRK